MSAEEITTKTDLIITDRAQGWSVTANEHGVAVSSTGPLSRSAAMNLANALHTAIGRLPVPPLRHMGDGESPHPF